MNTSKFDRIAFYTALLLSVAATSIISASSLLNLPAVWNMDEYSHGWLIPFVGAFIGWHILTQYKCEIAPSWSGVLVIFVSLVISAFAELAAFQALLNYSFLLALFGLSLAFFGKRFSLSLLPIFLFLLFAAPLPKIVFSELSIQLQLASSTLGADIIQLLGLSVYQEGNIIDLGDMKLQVIEACNGLRYLFPLMSLSFLIAYLMNDKWWKRITLFLSAIPITVFMNALRIAMVGITVNLWGQQMAEGVLHFFEGFVVFGICLTLLAGEAWLLFRIGDGGRFREEYLSLPRGEMPGLQTKIAPPVLIATLLCLGGLVLFESDLIKNRTDLTPPVPNFSAFPMTMGEWTGTEGRLKKEELDVLEDLSGYLIADYQAQRIPEPVNLYIAYYARQRMLASIHMPLNCFVGSGWEISDQETTIIKIGVNDIPVVRVVMRKQQQTLLVYYWLEQRGRQINDSFSAKIYLALDSVMMHRSDGALVRVVTPLKAGEDPSNGDARLKEFLNDAYTEVFDFVSAR